MMPDKCPKCNQALLIKGKHWAFCDNCSIEITEEKMNHKTNYEIDIIQKGEIIEHWECRDTSMITRVLDACLLEDIQHGKEIRIRRIQRDEENAE